MHEKLVGDHAQSLGQRGGKLLGVGVGIFVVDRAHRIDMLIHQFDRNARHVGRMLDQPAQAVGGQHDQGKSEGRGLALDVMGGVKKVILARVGEAAGGDTAPGLIQAYGMPSRFFCS